MSVSQVTKARIFLMYFIFMFLVSSTVFAAMDPVEVQERNKKATYQVVGEVIADELFQDITKEDKHPKQIRKMTIQISEIEKAPDHVSENNTVEVYYHYIPSWIANEYVGSTRMDITVGDVINIFLSKGEYGWEPVLAGNSVKHISYNEDREEHISEPFWHKVSRWIGDLGNIKTDIFILTGLVAVLVWAAFRGLRKMAKRKI